MDVDTGHEGFSNVIVWWETIVYRSTVAVMARTLSGSADVRLPRPNGMATIDSRKNIDDLIEDFDLQSVTVNC